MTGLAVALGITVALLGGVVLTGLQRRRKLHYALVVAFFVSLAVATRIAGRVGAGLAYEGTAAIVHTWHFAFVWITLLSVPVVVWSGVRLARSPAVEPSRRRAHRLLAFAFVALVVVTSALGTAMTLLARRL